MNTNRPDIFKAIGLLLGAVCFLFFIKFLVIIMSLIILLISSLKNI